MESPEDGKGEKLKEFPNGKQSATLEDFAKEIQDAVKDPDKFDRAMKYTFKLFDSNSYFALIL